MKEKIKHILNDTEIGKLFKFGLSSGTSFVIDICLFQLFLIVISLIFKDIDETLKIWIATIMARACSSFYNFLINKILVFQNKAKIRSTIYKYYILCIFQMCMSALLVSLIYSIIQINETIIKLFVDIIIFFVNYIIQNKIIFKK